MRRIPIPQGSAWRQRVRLDGDPYVLRASWNSRSGQWILSLETVGGDLIHRVPMVLDFPLLALITPETGKPPGELMVINTSGRREDPGRHCFERGSCRLVYIPESELQEIF